MHRLLRVVKVPCEKRRFGNPYRDGGYAVCVLPNGYDFFLTMGIGGDDSFEVAISRFYWGRLPGHAYDDQRTSLPNACPGIDFTQMAVGANLPTLLPPGAVNILLKCDIEGAEYTAFAAMSSDDMRRLRQVIIEFHEADLPEHRALMSRFLETHYLAHVHANNSCTCVIIDGCKFPPTVECTYVRKGDLPSITGELDTSPIPHPGLDVPNLQEKSDITLP